MSTPAADERDARPVLVVGDGIAGRATALALLQAGVPVRLLYRAPGESSESWNRHDGVDAAVGDGDSPTRHAEDLARAAGALGHAPALAALAEAGPELSRRLTRWGIPFERDESGSLALERCPAASAARTAHAGALTARHVGRRLGQRLLGYEASGALTRHPDETLLDLVLGDDGSVVGCVARNERTGELRAIRADGVCLATGGSAGLHWAPSHHTPSLGAAQGLAFRHGALLQNPDVVRTSALGYTAAGFTRVLPERALRLGGKLESGLLDLSELDRASLRKAVGPALAAHALHTGLDAFAEPIPVVTVVTRSLGGLWVDFDADDPSSERSHATSLRGLFAVGGATALYFGAALLGGTPLLAALFGAERAARALGARRESIDRSAFDLPNERFDEAVERQREHIERSLDRDDADAPDAFELRRELGELLSSDADGSTGRSRLDSLAARLATATPGDPSPVANQGLETLLSLEAVLPLARALTTARARRRRAPDAPVLLGWDADAGVVSSEVPR